MLKPSFINVELAMLKHGEFHMKEEDCKATSECSDKRDYSVRSVSVESMTCSQENQAQYGNNK